MLTIMTQRGPPGTRRATFLIAAFFARMGRRVVRAQDSRPSRWYILPHRRHDFLDLLAHVNGLAIVHHHVQD